MKLIHQKASRMLSILNDRELEYEPYLTQIRAMEGYDLFLDALASLEFRLALSE